MISSTSNSRIKNIVNLKNSARARRQQDCFLVEGPRMFFEVPKDRLLEVYVTEEFEEKYGDRLAGCRYERISDAVCRHLSDTRTPQGVTALVKKQEASLEEMLADESPCLFLLENLQYDL